jgi:superfamily II DNA or RNA helicase
MKGDFEDYDKKYNTIKNKIHTIMAGDEKCTNKQITISTWQSLQSRYLLQNNISPAEFFGDFKVLIMDEFHEYGKTKANDAKCVVKNVELCSRAEWRLGATGTLDNWGLHHLIMEGLVGEIYRIAETDALIKNKILSPLKIHCYVFKYPESESKLMAEVMKSQGDKRRAYQKEIEYIYSHLKRNNAICKLVSMLKQNTLVMFTRVNHGKWLHKRISELTKGTNKVFYIDGSTSVDEREDVRAQFERDSCCICVASVLVFGTGINIKNLHNIVSAVGQKSKIKVLQKIGRGLRLHESKKLLNVIDIIDDMSYTYIDEKTNRKHTLKNFAMRHHEARLVYYEREKFPYEIHKINMEG